MHVIAAKAVAFQEAMQPDFRLYQRAVVANARALGDELVSLGIRLVTGGTDNHIVLVDLSAMNVTGADASAALDAAGITVNMNAIPFDTRPPRIASGIRLGTPAVTSRGFEGTEMRKVAQLIVRMLSHLGDKAVTAEIRSDVEELCVRFPQPGLNAA